MNFVICDDLEREVRFLEENLNKLLSLTSEESLIFHFNRSADIIEYLSVSPDTPDVAIISLNLRSSSGFALAEQLGHIYPKMRLILIGSEPGNVERMFEIGVSYFLYSPISSESFQKFMSRLNGLMFTENEKYLSLTSKKGIANIAFSDILYIMSDRRKVIVYQPRGKTDEVYMKLDRAEEALDSRFVRCHQSYLVNMDYIHGITNEGFTLIGDIFIPISQNRYWASKRHYVNYIKSRG